MTFARTPRTARGSILAVNLAPFLPDVPLLVVIVAGLIASRVLPRFPREPKDPERLWHD